MWPFWGKPSKPAEEPPKPAEPPGPPPTMYRVMFPWDLAALKSLHSKLFSFDYDIGSFITALQSDRFTSIAAYPEPSPETLLGCVITTAGPTAMFLNMASDTTSAPSSSNESQLATPTTSTTEPLSLPASPPTEGPPASPGSSYQSESSVAYAELQAGPQESQQESQEESDKESEKEALYSILYEELQAGPQESREESEQESRKEALHSTPYEELQAGPQESQEETENEPLPSISLEIASEPTTTTQSQENIEPPETSSRDQDLHAESASGQQDMKVIEYPQLVQYLSEHPDEKCMYICWLGVSPAAQGQGIGSELLQHAVTIAESARAEHVLLHVQADNHRAQRFYLRHGFRALCTVPGFYELSDAGSTAVDALLMYRNLADEGFRGLDALLREEDVAVSTACGTVGVSRQADVSQTLAASMQTTQVMSQQADTSQTLAASSLSDAVYTTPPYTSVDCAQVSFRSSNAADKLQSASSNHNHAPSVTQSLIYATDKSIMQENRMCDPSNLGKTGTSWSQALVPDGCEATDTASEAGRIIQAPDSPRSGIQASAIATDNAGVSRCADGRVVQDVCMQNDFDSSRHEGCSSKTEPDAALWSSCMNEVIRVFDDNDAVRAMRGGGSYLSPVACFASGRFDPGRAFTRQHGLRTRIHSTRIHSVPRCIAHNLHVSLNLHPVGHRIPRLTGHRSPQSAGHGSPGSGINHSSGSGRFAQHCISVHAQRCKVCTTFCLNSEHASCSSSYSSSHSSIAGIQSSILHAKHFRNVNQLGNVNHFRNVKRSFEAGRRAAGWCVR